MKIIKYLVFIILALLSNSSLRPMAGEEAYYDRDLADFTMIEVTNEPAKKAKMDVEEAKNLILKAEKKLRAIKDVAESDELQTTIKTTKSIANALRKLAFKNGP